MYNALIRPVAYLPLGCGKTRENVRLTFGKLCSALSETALLVQNPRFVPHVYNFCTQSLHRQFLFFLSVTGRFYTFCTALIIRTISKEKKILL